MRKLILLTFLLFSTALYSQQMNYKKIELQLESPAQLEKLASVGTDLSEAEVTKEGLMKLFVSDLEYQRILDAGFAPTILIDDWFAYYKSQPVMTEVEQLHAIRQSKSEFNVEGFGYGSMGGHYTFQEAIMRLDSLSMQYPNIITPKFSLGLSVEGRTVWCVKISDNPNINENEPQALFDGLIHAREPMSMMCIFYYMYYLAENYGTDPEVTYLINNRELYFAPVTNPDGYEYNRQTNPSGGGMWRKNRKNNGNGSYGIDLNRNYGYMWGYDNSGSSPDPSDETYRGTAAFSEPEASIIRDFALTKNFKTHINYHTYQNAIIHPWGYINTLPPDFSTYNEMASHMAKFNGYTFGTSYQTLGYNSNGTMRDWFYGEQSTKGKAYSFVFEVGGSSDGFWAPMNRILPLAQGNLRPNLYISWMAGEYVRLKNYQISKPYLLAGDTASVQLSLTNSGLSTGYTLTVEASSLSPLIIVNSNVITIDSIQSRSDYSVPQTLPFTVAADATAGQTAKLVIRTKTSGITMSSDTITVFFGYPITAFADTTNNPANMWTITATPATPKWDSTSTVFQTAPVSYTDSKTGNYVANATVIMELTNPVRISAGSKLSYYTKWDIENNWDYGQVEITTNNGSTWTPLSGAYMNAGTGSFQPNGQPLYDNVQAAWVYEEISLQQYANQMAKIRFKLRSDGSQHRDGWYVDDIKIRTLASLTLTSLNNGDTLLAGSIKSITWNSVNIDTVQLMFSSDNGTTWSVVAGSIPASVATFDWQVPQLASNQCRFRVSAKALPELSDISDQKFTISQGLQYISPNSGAVLFAGETDTIRWVSQLTQSEQVNIELKLDPGTPWVPITPQPVSASLGAYVWTVPYFETDSALIRIVSVSNPSLQSVSVPFPISIRWMSSQLIQPSNNSMYQPRTVTFLWSKAKAITEVIDGYHLQVTSDTAAMPYFTNDSTLTDTMRVVSGLEFKTKYYWRVAAQSGPVWGDFSSWNSFTTILQPVNSPTQLTATALAPKRVKLYWIDNSTNESGFWIERKDGDSASTADFVFLDSVATDVSTFTDTTIADAVSKYTYRIKAYSQDTVSAYSLFATVTTLTAIDDGTTDKPKEYVLHQNYPNPFNPETVIRFGIPKESTVALRIYASNGELIRELVNNQLGSGYYEIKFDASKYASGIYFYELDIRNGNEVLFRELRKMLYVK